MEISKRFKLRIFIQTVIFAAVFLTVDAAVGYYIASMEAANKILTELSK